MTTSTSSTSGQRTGDPGIVLPPLRRIDWNRADAAARAAALARPPQSRDAALQAGVARIIAQVRADGDSTLRALTRRFDGCELDDLEVPQADIDAADAALAPPLAAAFDEAIARIEAFHRAGAPPPYAVETAPGLRCERIVRAIDRVGLYVPAGTAPLPSTALMLGVPARLAGCSDVILCTPPRADGSADPLVLAAAARCGIRRVFRLGGAQAIAAMAYGSDSVPRCDKLFGPGNAWVTEAKRQVSTDPDGAAIDMPAGPSEVLVIADRHADAAFIAADLLSQAEHGADSQVILVTDAIALADAVEAEIASQCARLPRGAIAGEALAHARIVLVADIEQAIEVSNRYAPEHLIVATESPRALVPLVRAAGSVFLGRWTPEALGDYCSGTNHVLPTAGAARAWSGVSVASFQRLITVQEAQPQGLATIGPCALTLARAEGLDAHAQAVSIRLARIEEGRA